MTTHPMHGFKLLPDKSVMMLHVCTMLDDDQVSLFIGHKNCCRYKLDSKSDVTHVEWCKGGGIVE